MHRDTLVVKWLLSKVRSSEPAVTARAAPAKAGNAVMAGRKQVCLRMLAVVVFSLIARSAFNQTQGPVQPPKQPSEPQIKPGQGIKVDVDMTLVNLTVTDPLDRLVTGLERENFRVYEDGIEQEVLTMSSEDVPVSIGLVFDMSGSMSDKV